VANGKRERELCEPIRIFTLILNLSSRSQACLFHVTEYDATAFSDEESVKSVAREEAEV